MIKPNTLYEILTPSGFQPFKGIKSSQHFIVKKITFKDGNTIEGSLDHVIWVDEQPIALKQINQNSHPSIQTVEIVSGKFTLFTIQGVKGEKFLVNQNIISSNCAFIPEKIFEEFYSSTYPTISSGDNTKIIVTSSAKDLNHFYEMWKDALDGKNTYKPIEIKWFDVPGRDHAWKAKVVSDVGQKKFDREFGNEFFGNTSVVIPLALLKALKVGSPLKEGPEIKVFEFPQKDRRYLAIVDVAEGKGDGDNSVIVIIKIPEKNENAPYKVVFVYKSNEVAIFSFIETVFTFCSRYNEALLIPEVNIHDIATPLYSQYEYVNIIRTTIKKQKIASPFTQEKTKLGVKTTSAVKSLGLSSLIQIFEEGLLDISDISILKELTTLVRKDDSFAAKSGLNDDLAMCLILFAWTIREQQFIELMDIENQKLHQIQQNYVKQLYDDLPSFFVDRGDI